jgi:hypothetical protein
MITTAEPEPIVTHPRRRAFARDCQILLAVAAGDYWTAANLITNSRVPSLPRNLAGRFRDPRRRRAGPGHDHRPRPLDRVPRAGLLTAGRVSVPDRAVYRRGGAVAPTTAPARRSGFFDQPKVEDMYG